MSTNDYLNLSPRSTDPSKFFGLSVVIHVSLAVGSLFVVVPALENLKKEIVIIELQTEEVPVVHPVKTMALAHGEKTFETKGAEKAMAPAPSAPLEAEEAKIVAGPVQKTKVAPQKRAQVKTQVSQGEAVVAKTSTSRAGVPETLEDIAAPDLDMDGVAASRVGNLGDNEFENEFKNIDQSNEAAVRAERAQLDAETKQIGDEKEAALQALQNENALKAKAMEDALKATRDKNAASLAQMKATERAAADKATNDAKLDAEAAAAANKGSGENLASRSRGDGQTGADQAAIETAGEPEGVRSLEQLRQIPGNPKPQYSMEERLQRQNGAVVFYAFITKSGYPSQFRLVQSTGHRSLDGKTLAALKKWKFYPGQQGWVEIPFKWDLKGGAEEMPTSLRRYGSSQ